MAKGKRWRLTVVYEFDQDIVPGWGHQLPDWERQVTDGGIARQTHYNATVTVVNREVGDYKFVSGQGWVAPTVFYLADANGDPIEKEVNVGS